MFDVYVEGPVDPSPDGMRRLAEAMSMRYGLPVADLITRMTKGRFRVKGNIDQGVAMTYVSDLQAVGARVTVAESRISAAALPQPRGATPVVAPPPAAPVVAPAPVAPVTAPAPVAPVITPVPVLAPPPGSPVAVRSGLTPASTDVTVPGPARPGRSSLPPATTARPAASVLPPSGPRPATSPAFASGLSAAFTDQPAVANLGALGALGDEGGFSLASLHGDPETKEPTALFAARAGSVAEPPPGPTKATPVALPSKDAPLDLFAPPDAGEAETFKVDIAPSPKSPSTAASTSPAVASASLVAGGPPATPVLKPRIPLGTTPAVQVLGVVAPEPPRWRFAAGVLIAIVLGFVPAHVIASIREGSAFSKIDAHVVQMQADVDSPDAPIPYEKLDEFRRSQEELKKAERRTIALTAIPIWAAVAALLAYVWFRRIPWDRLPRR